MAVDRDRFKSLLKEKGFKMTRQRLVVLEVLTHVVSLGTSEGGIVNRYALEGSLFDWRGLALAAVLLVLTNWVKPTKKLHPIVFIVLSAVVGVAFHFAGV